MDLQKKLEEISEKFNKLEEEKNQFKMKIDEIEKEQYRLQGEHRIVSSIIEELTPKDEENKADQ